jgi:hypothetical protein
MKQFHYYIYIDYSENYVGYTVIKNEQVKELLVKIKKLKHYRAVKHKKEYIKAIRNVFAREKIADSLYRYKARQTKHNLEIYTDVAGFLSCNDSCIVFISVDNNQYSNFIRLVKIIGANATIVKESELKEGSVEYRLSLIIDNLLNLERTRKQSK